MAKAYGDRWPSQKARIFDIAHTYLTKRLDPADLLIKGAGGFVIASATPTGPEAHVRAASLAHGLTEHFLGEAKADPTVRVEVQSSNAEIAVLAAAVGEVSFIVAPPAMRHQAGSGLAGTDWRFQPVWDVRRQALGSYYLVPWIRETQQRLPGYQFEASVDAPKSFTVIDEASLWVAEMALRDLFAREGRALVGVAVHSSTLTNLASRTKIFKAMESFDKELLRYKTIKIANVVPGFPRIYLNEIVSALKLRIPNVVISAAWDEPDIAGLLQCGPVAVGFALPKSVLGINGRVDQATLVAKIRSAAAIAHAGQKLFFVEGEIPRELAVRLCEVGVDNISSPHIWPPCSAPESVVKWSAAKLLVA